jgi:hypothetical protein
LVNPAIETLELIGREYFLDASNTSSSEITIPDPQLSFINSIIWSFLLQTLSVIQVTTELSVFVNSLSYKEAIGQTFVV